MNECGSLTITPRTGHRGKPGIDTIRLLRRDLGGTPTNSSKESPKKEAQKPIGPYKIPEGMKLVPVNWSRAPVQKKETKEGGNPAFVFVDVPNLTGRRLKSRNGEDINRRVLPLEEVNWCALLLEINKGPGSIGGLHIAKALAYSLKILDGFGNDMIRRAGFPLVTHEKDIDPLMAGDIGIFGLKAIQRFRSPTIVVVSSDGDYGFVLERLREEARSENVNLRIWVIGWRGHTHAFLQKQANWVTFLDSMPDFLGNRVMARLREEKRKKVLDQHFFPFFPSL